MPAHFKDLCLDASDHQALADWWCAALGYVRHVGESPRPLDWPVPIEDPAGQGPLIWINPVPEPKSVKNRMHVDVVGDKAELLSLGATMVRARDDEIEWDILADPEGTCYTYIVASLGKIVPADDRYWPMRPSIRSRSRSA